MNRSDAKQIAEVITYKQLVGMFDNAKIGVKDWTEVSCVNQCMTKGTAWNILYKGLSPRIMNQKVALNNMIREFGDYLAHGLELRKKIKFKPDVKIFHQEPIF